MKKPALFASLCFAFFASTASAQGTREAAAVSEMIDVSRAKVAAMPAPQGTIKVDPNLKLGRVIGGVDLDTWYYTEFDMPDAILDQDGGEIRVIMQHETDPNDQVRTIDLNVGCEWSDNTFGARGRQNGLYCWGRQVGGGETAFILGDPTNETLWSPWGWVYFMDYKWLDGNASLGNKKIRIYSHPHVTTRVLFYD